MILFFKDEQEWLEARRKDVTSTEIAAIFGLHPYKSRLRLWHEKAGNVNLNFVETEFTKWGRRLQIPVGMGVCEDEGWTGYDMTGYYLRDEKHRIGASYDIKAFDVERGMGDLEIKIAERFDENLGWTKDQTPLAYEFQEQLKLHLCAKDMPEIKWGCIATLGARQKVRKYFRKYDAELGLVIEDAVDQFWKSIEENKPPSPDYAVDGELLERLRKPMLNDDTLILTGNNRAHELAESYNELRLKMALIKAEADPIKDAMDKIKAEMWQLMGNKGRAIIGGYTVGARVQKTEEFINYGNEYRRFDFKKLKKGN